MNKLGVYWSVMHRRPQDYRYFERLNPAVVKIMDGGHPDYQWVYSNLPNTRVLARDWALSEQYDDMRRDPVGTGKRHAREWADHALRLGFDRGRTHVLGINEPRVWEAGVPEAVTAYTVAFLDECGAVGLRAGALQFAVGWPANTGTDTPPNWEPYAPVADAIRRGGHVLVCHEYWADSGPGELWGWWGGRALRCPWDVPIIIGECGIDQYVKNGAVGQAQRGWQAHKSAGQYAAELADYTGRMAQDKRFVGCCVFASDFANREWAGFDVEPAYEAILSVPVQRPTAQTPQGYVPIAGDRPTVPAKTDDNWERAIAWVLRWEGGFQADPADVGNYYNGQLIGTKYGISAASWGHLYDIPNLTLEQARAIYRQHYWQASGADKYDWPLCLAHFDTAVNAGVGRAKEMLEKSEGDFLAYMGHLISWYTRIDGFEHFGRAWIRRRAEILLEAAK